MRSQSMTKSGEPNWAASASRAAGAYGAARLRSVFNPASPSLQQGIDQGQEPIERAAVRVEHGPPGGAHDRAQLRVLEEPGHRVRELTGVRDDEGGAGVHEEPRDLLAVEVVRAGEDRPSD